MIETLTRNDAQVLKDAATMLETAARKIRKLADSAPYDDCTTVVIGPKSPTHKLLSEIHANITAAQARL